LTRFDRFLCDVVLGRAQPLPAPEIEDRDE
jgi:hypothetical protein